MTPLTIRPLLWLCVRALARTVHEAAAAPGSGVADLSA
jgi:hypothetical protein